MNSLSDNDSILSKTLENAKIPNGIKVEIVQNAESIFERMPNSANNVSNNVGLLVGKVQSGKTSNIIGLAANALDHGYRLVIMLLADTTILLNQNFDRICNAFSGIDDVYVAKESQDGDFEAMSTDEIDYLYESGKSLVVCSLKHYGRIDNIRKILSKTKFLNDYTLIVDDEADDVSQNTNRYKYVCVDGKWYENERSATNESIVNLRRSFERLAYISVTASPQANILLQKFQSLSPNFCVTIDPGEYYYDLPDFHDPENSKVVEINDFEKSKINSYVPNSLYNALCFFVAGILVRQKRVHGNNFKSSFLIHPSKLIIDHQVLFDMLNEKIESIKASLRAENQKGLEFLNDVKKEYSEYLPADELTMSQVLSILKGLKMHCINKDADEKNLVKAMEVMPNHIVVGGDMIDRGLTLPGLTVAYVTRESEIGQADTLLQRARWLGYKEGYFDLCRIYLTPDLKNQYEALIDHYESVWDFLCYCSDVKADLRKEQVELRINPDILSPTSRSKAPVDYERLSSNYVMRYFTSNYSYNQENIELVKIYDELPGTIKSYNQVQTHKVCTVNVSTIINLLSKFHASSQEYDATMATAISRLQKVKDPDTTDAKIYRMRINDNEERSTEDAHSYVINNILQGRSQAKRPGDEGFYPGDRYIKEDCITLQIHHVILKNDVENTYKKGEEVIMLALFFPDSFKKSITVMPKKLI